jgi:hypothetical protein
MPVQKNSTLIVADFSLENRNAYRSVRQQGVMHFAWQTRG